MFKPGDLVMCLSNYEDQFTKGNTYKVLAYHEAINYIDMVDDLGDKNSWGAKYFKLVKSQAKSKSRYRDWEYA